MYNYIDNFLQRDTAQTRLDDLQLQLKRAGEELEAKQRVADSLTGDLENTRRLLETLSSKVAHHSRSI